MNNPLKTFDDLVFAEVTKSSIATFKASLRFENGYGVSVLTGPGALATIEKPYELAVIKYQDDNDYQIIYPTLFNSDVIPCLTCDEVTQYMNIIQSLPELF
ncbi:MAG: hypothetical protein IJZ70_07995 [Bacteroidales bacterium]|nr:hypothetical protein [Bacteroidales bacterium]